MPDSPFPTEDPGRGLAHHGLLHESDEEFFAVAMPFVREGLERGETVIVDVGKEHAAAFVDAFGDEPLFAVSAESKYGVPLVALSEFQRLIRLGMDEGANAFRLIGAIDFDMHATRWRDWIRYEAVVNSVMAGCPVQSLCAYDLRLPAEVLKGARRTHPVLRGADGARENAEYVDPQLVVQDPAYRAGPGPLQAEPPTLVLTDVVDLADMRMDVQLAAMQTVMPPRLNDFVSALNEVATNAIRHGQPPVVVRVWMSSDQAVATVTDQGEGVDDPFLGYVRPRLNHHDQPLGLWAARQLCDVLDYCMTPEGFTVHLVVGD